MTKIFLDTNVVLDFILKRSGFAEDAPHATLFITFLGSWK